MGFGVIWGEGAGGVGVGIAGGGVDECAGGPSGFHK